MFVIRVSNPEGTYVAGYNSQHQLVQLCHVRAFAKKFRSANTAQRWAVKYQDAGYGLRSQSWSVQSAK